MGTPALALWVAPVAAAAAQAVDAGDRWLSASERLRLEGMTAPRRRRQFLAGRWALRHLLAAEYGGDALRDWRTTAADRGPPCLAAPQPSPILHLAVSHSGDWVACGVSAQPLGLDLETPRPRHRVDVDGLIQATCTPAERGRLLRREDDRAAHFHVAWTLKEAWLKKHGEGITPGRLTDLETVECAGSAEANARVWRGPEFVLALVAPTDATLSCHRGEQDIGRVDPTWWHVAPRDRAG